MSLLNSKINSIEGEVGDLVTQLETVYTQTQTMTDALITQTQTMTDALINKQQSLIVAGTDTNIKTMDFTTYSTTTGGLRLLDTSYHLRSLLAAPPYAFSLSGTTITLTGPAQLSSNGDGTTANGLNLILNNVIKAIKGGGYISLTQTPSDITIATNSNLDNALNGKASTASPTITGGLTVTGQVSCNASINFYANADRGVATVGSLWSMGHNISGSLGVGSFEIAYNPFTSNTTLTTALQIASNGTITIPGNQTSSTLNNI